jgi:hypothetical protein
VCTGVKPSQIGVITPYNGQLEVLRELMFPSTDTKQGEAHASDDKSGAKKPAKLLPVKSKPKVYNPLVDSSDAREVDSVNLEGLEIKTIDGFQGGEKECILLSLVRSNANHTVGFLGERRRINVAVTRAKRHLAVFCDADTCSVDAFMRTLIEHMGTEGDHISAEEYLDYVAAGGYGACAHHSTTGKLSSGSKVAPAKAGAVNVAKELKKLTSTIEKADFMLVMEKLKSGTILPGETSKNAVVNIVIPQPSAVERSANAETGEPDAAEAGELKETVTARLSCSTGVLRFPASMNSYLRMVVHECAELLGLRHRSTGEGNERCIEVCVEEFPAEAEALSAGPGKRKGKGNKPAAASAGVTGGSSAPQASEEVKKPAPAVASAQPASTVPVLATVPASQPKADITGSDSDSDNNVDGVTEKAPQPKKPAAKKAGAAKGKEAYMGADRRSALGRLEAEHEATMKQAALDEDALLEAAIQHNQVSGR